jgi:hypothetical protein
MHSDVKGAELIFDSAALTLFHNQAFLKHASKKLN